jgi:hypothetical protein
MFQFFKREYTDYRTPNLYKIELVQTFDRLLVTAIIDAMFTRMNY